MTLIETVKSFAQATLDTRDYVPLKFRLPSLSQHQAELDSLTELGIDPLTCWTARKARNGKYYPSLPGLWSDSEGQLCLLFNFKSQDREDNILKFSEFPDHQFIISEAEFSHLLTIKKSNKTVLVLPIYIHLLDRDSDPSPCRVGDLVGVLKSLPVPKIFEGEDNRSALKLVDGVPEFNEIVQFNITNITCQTYEFKGKELTNYFVTVKDLGVYKINKAAGLAILMWMMNNDVELPMGDTYLEVEMTKETSEFGDYLKVIAINLPPSQIPF